MSAIFGILNREFRWKCSVVFSSWKWKTEFSDLLGCHAAVRRRKHSKRREHSSETVISTSINEGKKQSSWIPCWILGFVNSHTEIRALSLDAECWVSWGSYGKITTCIKRVNFPGTNKSHRFQAVQTVHCTFRVKYHADSRILGEQAWILEEMKFTN